MKLWQKIVLQLLYLTPFGYLLSSYSLIQGKRTPGIFISLESYSPIRAFTKEKPTFRERTGWFINGIILLIEGIFVQFYEIAGDIGGGFAFLAFIFGLVSLVSAIFPRAPWNRKIF